MMQSIPKGKVLVTGGSGHVGANLVRRLLDDGEDVRCMVHPRHNNLGLDGLDLEIVKADLRDAEAVESAVTGCARVFHVGAKVSTRNASAGEEREIFETNVLGTRNVARASLRQGVARVVMTGSFSAVGHDLDKPERPCNEDMPFYPFDEVMPYARTKAAAEHELYKAIASGLDGVIATSCSIIGPYDYWPSRMGRSICSYVAGRMRAVINGGFDFVSASDLIDGHIRAMESGRCGEKYILSTEFKTLPELVDILREVSGKSYRPMVVPAKMLSAVTSVYTGALAKYFPNAQQSLTPGTIRILQMRRRADTRKAQRELGYKPTSIRQAATEAIEFFSRQKMIA